jgi:CubicO group peptidase (beta-lactamase class C family)
LFRLFRLIPSLLCVLALTSCGGRRAVVNSRAADGVSGPWLQYVDVREAGFDADALATVCERADRLHSGALLAVFRQHVLVACGDVGRRFELHSIRKSLVSGLFGIAVARGEIDLDATLGDFGVQDRTPLTATERSATIRDVISARSGVYLPAAYGASQERSRPARGTHAPGTHWFYNNWDFNIAGVIYEQAVGEDLYQSFTRRLARPLGMEDWRTNDGFRVFEPTKSHHPAHTFRLSARDLARFGQLYLQKGSWEGRQILAQQWVEESTRPHTDDGDGTGYGYMWWTYQAGGPFTARYPMLGRHTIFRGLGTGEQGLWVIPGAELVVVHRADTDHGRSVPGDAHWQLVEGIVAARRSQPVPEPRLEPLVPAAFSTQLPPVDIPDYRAIQDALRNEYIGDFQLTPGPVRLGRYALTDGGIIRIFVFDEKPYVHLPGLGDLQLFPVRRDVFTSRVLLRLTVAFSRDSAGRVNRLSMTHEGDTLNASRSSK